MARIGSPRWIALALALLTAGCCPPVTQKEFDKKVETFLDGYRDLVVTLNSCYSRPTEAQRTTCYQNINLTLAQLMQRGNELKESFGPRNCDLTALENALRGLEAIAGSIIAAQGNLWHWAERIDVQLQGTGQGDAVTTVTLGGSSTLRMEIEPGGPILGPISVTGTFSVDLQAFGSFLMGPVTGLALSFSEGGLLPWQATLLSSPQNQCTLQPPVGGVRRGTLVAAVRLASGSIGFPLLFRLPVEASESLAGWTISTGVDLVPAAPYFPMAQVSDVRLAPGCPGSNGRNPSIQIASVPRVGDPLVVRLDQARPQSVAILCVGESSTSWLGVPLPFDLGAAGAPGCMLRVSLTLLLTSPTSAAGSGVLNLPIPSDPSLAFASAFHQWLVLDPANALGLVVTDGIRTNFFAR